MTLFGFNIHVSRAERRPASNSLEPVQKAAYSPESWLRGEDVAAGPQLSNAYEQVVWVYRAINVLAEQVANVPFVFSAGARGEENLITSGPLLDFYARPHPLLNRFQYWELRVIWLMLRGECFRVPIYEDAAGALSHSPLGTFRSPHSAFRTGDTPHSGLKGVLLLDPARFQHIIDDHKLIGWRYTGLGSQTPLASQVFLPEEVWFEKLPNPFDFWRGLPPLYVAGMAVQTDFAAGAFMRGMIENNCDTGLIVRTDKWLSPQQREEIVAALRERKRRAGQADRPILLLGSTEVIKPQLSSSDLQFLENRKFSRSEICAAFGVPEEIVTTTEHAKYDVMAGARLNFIENRVAPLCSRLEAEEDITVKSIDARASGWFDLDSLPILQEGRRSRLVVAKTGFEMGIPFNQLNRVFDLGFKPLPWGDYGYMSTKLQRVGEDSPKAEAQSPMSKVQCPKSGEADPFARVTQFLVELNPHVTAPRQSAGPFLHKAGLGEVGSNSRKTPSDSDETLPMPNPLLTRKLSRFFFEQRGRTLAALPVVLRSIDPRRLCADSLSALLDLPFENDQLLNHLKPLLQAEPEPHPTATAGSPGPHEPGSSYLQTRVPALEQINLDTLQALQFSLLEGLTAHEPLEQLIARMKAVFNHACDVRAETVARAETAALLLLRKGQRCEASSSSREAQSTVLTARYGASAAKSGSCGARPAEVEGG